MRIYISAAKLNELGDALEATPFSDRLKELLWSELNESSRFPMGRDGFCYCASVIAALANDDVIGFRQGDWIANLDMGLSGELMLAALRAFKRSSVEAESGHSETPELVAQSG